ncbi:MAG: hypothetical protein K5886_02970 [Lachnospiraceae bacterium]|nr:hypothetical protein [Lachnospiraceae bacterium]
MKKLAFVKQDVYSDLYICGTDEKRPDEILFSSNGRVGPIGLWEDFDVDFYIVKECPEKECQVWKKEFSAENIKIMERSRDTPLNEIKGQEFKDPGSVHTPSEFSVSVDEIPWEKYDIVFSMNVSVPTRIVMNHPEALWVHMSGESNIFADKAYYGYDVCLSQQTTGLIDYRKHRLDFPYTYVGGETLENIVRKNKDIVINEKKKGIFAEINCVTERPVTKVPQLDPVSEKTGQPLIFHKQNIKDNLQSLINAKYYAKWGGRKTRGNGAIEAISLGTPVLIRPDDIIHRHIIPKEGWIFSAQELAEKISYYDLHENAYEDLLKKERELVRLFCHDYPLAGLLEFERRKRETGRPNRMIRYNHTISRFMQKLNRIV